LAINDVEYSLCVEDVEFGLLTIHNHASQVRKPRTASAEIDEITEVAYCPPASPDSKVPK
jgi:hypothetical protein